VVRLRMPTTAYIMMVAKMKIGPSQKRDSPCCSAIVSSTRNRMKPVVKETRTRRRRRS
jgi:hypothetical protein